MAVLLRFHVISSEHMSPNVCSLYSTHVRRDHRPLSTRPLVRTGIHPDLIDLDKAISGVFDTALSGFGVSELIQRAAEVQRLRSRLDAVLGQHLVAATDTAALTPSYRGIPATDIAAGSHTNPRPLRAAAVLNRWLEKFPVFADAHRDGVLSTEHLQALKTVDRDAVHHLLIGSQELLVDIARSLDWVDFGRALAHWVNAADPDGQQPTEELRNKPTGLSHKTNDDGTIDGRFHLDALAAQAFNNALGPEIEKLFKQPPENSDGKPARRTAYQLAGQALLNLIIRGHQHPNGSPTVPAGGPGHRLPTRTKHPRTPPRPQRRTRRPVNHRPRPLVPLRGRDTRPPGPRRRPVRHRQDPNLDLGRANQSPKHPKQSTTLPRMHATHPPPGIQRTLHHHRMRRTLPLAPSRPHQTRQPRRTNHPQQRRHPLRTPQPPQSRPRTRRRLSERHPSDGHCGHVARYGSPSGPNWSHSSRVMFRSAARQAISGHSSRFRFHSSADPPTIVASRHLSSPVAPSAMFPSSLGNAPR